MKFLAGLFSLIKNVITIGFATICALLVLSVAMPKNFIQAIEYIMSLL